MSDFMNTVDVVGDGALTNSIIDRSVTEIADNMVKSIGVFTFAFCPALTIVKFSAAQRIQDEAFYGCAKLTTADFLAATSMAGTVFDSCSALTALILRSETMATLSSTTALSGTPIESGTGYIYVPRALVDSYKAASNWSTYANQFRAIEDYTVDGTTTGALDETKI